MTVHWAPEVPPIRFAKFEREGDTVRGRLVAYQPHHGAMNYDRTAEVGCVVLEQPNGDWVKVGLDKGQLATAVDHAHMALVHAPSGSAGSRPYLAIRFEGKSDKGHKVFRARGGWEAPDGG